MAKFFGKLKMSVIQLLLRLWPSLGFRLFARDQGDGNGTYEKLHEALAGCERVDFEPSPGNQRGFRIVLDKRTALYFYQNGDHFEYDGFELGEYEAGDVTVLDSLR